MTYMGDCNCGWCLDCLERCEERLMADLPAYAAVFVQVVHEFLGQSLGSGPVRQHFVADSDGRLSEDDTASISNFWERRVRPAHVRQALVTTMKSRRLKDPAGAYSYATRLLWDGIDREAVFPRKPGSPWGIKEDDLLLRALRARTGLRTLSDRFGCTPQALLSRAERLLAYGAFPEGWLWEWRESAPPLPGARAG